MKAVKLVALEAGNFPLATKPTEQDIFLRSPGNDNEERKLQAHQRRQKCFKRSSMDNNLGFG